MRTLRIKDRRMALDWRGKLLDHHGRCMYCTGRTAYGDPCRRTATCRVDGAPVCAAHQTPVKAKRRPVSKEVPVVDHDLSDLHPRADGNYWRMVRDNAHWLCTGHMRAGGPCNRFAICQLAGQPKCSRHVTVTKCELCHRGMKMTPGCVRRCATCRAAARKRVVSFYFSRCEDLCDDVLEKVLGYV